MSNSDEAKYRKCNYVKMHCVIENPYRSTIEMNESNKKWRRHKYSTHQSTQNVNENMSFHIDLFSKTDVYRLDASLLYISLSISRQIFSNCTWSSALNFRNAWISHYGTNTDKFEGLSFQSLSSSSSRLMILMIVFSMLNLVLFSIVRHTECFVNCFFWWFS